ncbi:hypothetical protein BX600DRAFT_503807 [Xylariales sp. PMI_506]|nr:hypothetical protein BX600DRAFT_503807 [Xylariales sp. PMI_506]
MNGDKPPCSRCKTRGLNCTINKSLQMLLENDASWKEEMEERIQKLEEALLRASSTNNDNTGPENPDSLDSSSMLLSRRTRTSRNTPSTQANRTPNDAGSTTLNLSCSLGAFPSASVVNVSNADVPITFASRPDLIACRRISLTAAQECFTYYKKNLDPCVHHILEPSDTLADVRLRSSLLTAAICAVSSLSTASQDFQACYNAFTAEVSEKLFSDHYTFDDVRALCIGAFWLHDVSSALNGLAVRIATQLDLHRCITKMPHTKRACYDRTRLFFLVYLCDHHCSLAYGRPPMTRELRTLTSPTIFLQSEFSTAADLNLICQVELWSISRRVFDHFGADIESTIVRQRAAELERISAAYETWYQEWLQVLTTSGGSDAFVLPTLDLYFHSAKLYLFSHIFRGPSQMAQMDAKLVAGFAACAIESAFFIIRYMVDNREAQSMLGKLPCYFGTIIAFASVCLVKTIQQEQPLCSIDTNNVLDYLERFVYVLKTSLPGESTLRPLVGIAKSLEAALANTQRRDNHDPPTTVDDILI